MRRLKDGNHGKRTIQRWVLSLCALMLALACAAPAYAETPPPDPFANSDVIQFIPPGEYPAFLYQQEGLKVFCIPVGAQDCFLITCDGHAMMLDCGAIGREPTPDYLLRLLKALGVTRFDYAINTHPHGDHFFGFPELLAEVPADEVLVTFPLNFDWLQRKLVRSVTALDIPIRILEKGETIPFGAAAVATYRYTKSQNINDKSLVVHIRYGDRAILFTADIGPTAQRKMAVEFGERWRADILKLPHHGMGKLAVELYKAVQPELCFASNGETSKSVKLMREFLEKRDTPLFFTSRKPLVMLTDGKVWQVQQWRRDAIELPGYTHIPASEKDE